jgi:hypothetical protein
MLLTALMEWGTPTFKGKGKFYKYQSKTLTYPREVGGSDLRNTLK